MKLELDRYVPGLLLWISNRLTSSASQLYRSQFDIGVNDWRVLSYFHIYPGSTAASACELMGVDKAAVSRSIGVLAAAGHLKVQPLGQRKLECSLTASGRELHDRIEQIALAREDALMHDFSQEERAAVTRFLHRMLANTAALRQVAPPSLKR